MLAGEGGHHAEGLYEHRQSRGSRKGGGGKNRSGEQKSERGGQGNEKKIPRGQQFFMEK